jgi:hypothetical protein
MTLPLNVGRRDNVGKKTKAESRHTIYATRTNTVATSEQLLDSVGFARLVWEANGQSLQEEDP